MTDQEREAVPRQLHGVDTSVAVAANGLTPLMMSLSGDFIAEQCPGGAQLMDHLQVAQMLLNCAREKLQAARKIADREFSTR